MFSRPEVREVPADSARAPNNFLAGLRRQASDAAVRSAVARQENSDGGPQVVEWGDRLFRAGFYEPALRKFEAAATEAPALAAIQFRRGHTLVALGRFDEAARAFRRGLALDVKFAHSSRHLHKLYGEDGRAAFNRHLEALAGAALQDSRNPDLFFLVGLSLFCEGDQERARKFFRQAAELGGAEDPHLRPFLEAEPEPGTAKRDKLAAGGQPFGFQTVGLQRESPATFSERPATAPHPEDVSR